MTQLDFSQLWAEAAPFDDFLASASEHRGLWAGIYRLAQVPAWAREGVPAGTVRRFLVLAEDWCGDASNTIPILAKWVDQIDGLELRILRRDEYPAVMDQYLTDGSRSIPIVIALDEAFRELGHWGPRPLGLQRFVMQNKGRVPKDTLYPQVRRWYALDGGATTLNEVMDVAGLPRRKVA